MKQYTFILKTSQGSEIDRTTVNANNRVEAINHVKYYITKGRKYSMKLKTN